MKKYRLDCPFSLIPTNDRPQTGPEMITSGRLGTLQLEFVLVDGRVTSMNFQARFIW